MVPSLLTTLKLEKFNLFLIRFSWIQYFSVFIPVLILGESFIRFLFRFRFVHSHRRSNVPIELKEF
jgi:hypothetical protein